MREIKFRVWQKYRKRMLEVIGLKYENNELIEIAVKYPNGTIPNKIWYSKNNSDFYLYNDAGDCTLELMQYTGLKDKNGKEIYEGDILINDEKIIHEMIFIDGVFTRKGSRFPFCPDYSHIIGNIYENPELLEVEE